MTIFPAPHKRLVLAALMTVLTGCSTTQRPLETRRATFVDPALNIEVSANLGDTILKGQIADRLPAIELEADYTSNAFLIGDTYFPKQIMTASFTLNDHVVYQADKLFRAGKTHKLLGSSPLGQGFCLKDDPLVVALYIDGNECVKLKQPWPEFSKTTATSNNAFVENQELIFAGLKDGKISFIYLESQPNSDRPSFSHQVAVPYAKDDNFVYRGIKVKIIDASHTTLNYIVEDFGD